jgi:hypothetical protein
MGTKYRVDRVTNARTPCGMNSIRYIGDNWNVARALFDRISTGLDTWDQPNADYGVILSVWDESRRDYVVKCSRGL